MRILITGATGLIGSSLTAVLLALSHHITVLTRDERRARASWATSRAIGKRWTTGSRWMTSMR